jgi:hypothetical protein
VEQQEIDVVGPQFPEAFVNGSREFFFGIVVDPYFRCYEYFVTRNAGARDSFSDFPLMSVDLCRVDVPEAGA